MARRLRQESQTGLSPSLSAALATVARHGPLSPSELAAAEGIQRPTATRLVGKLEQAGLVARTTDPDDRRVRQVATTAEGRALLRRIRSRKTEFLAARMARLTAAERETLTAAAGILAGLLEERA